MNTKVKYTREETLAYYKALYDYWASCEDFYRDMVSSTGYENTKDAFYIAKRKAFCLSRINFYENIFEKPK